MKQFYVYLHLKPTGDPFYVGKGTGKRSHLFHDRNKHHKTVVAKHGVGNIEVLVFPQETETAAFDVETRFIQVLREAGFKLTNVCDGGEGASGRVLSEESLQKMSRSHSGQPAWNKGVPATEEAKAKMAKAQTGKKQSARTVEKRVSSRKGYSHTEDTKQKIRTAHEGKRMSETACENMSKAKKGTIRSEAARKATSVALTGKPWSAARRAAENKRNTQEVVCPL